MGEEPARGSATYKIVITIIINSISLLKDA